MCSSISRLVIFYIKMPQMGFPDGAKCYFLCFLGDRYSSTFVNSSQISPIVALMLSKVSGVPSALSL